MAPWQPSLEMAVSVIRCNSAATRLKTGVIFAGCGGSSKCRNEKIRAAAVSSAWCHQWALNSGCYQKAFFSFFKLFAFDFSNEFLGVNLTQPSRFNA